MSDYSAGLANLRRPPQPRLVALASRRLRLPTPASGGTRRPQREASYTTAGLPAARRALAAGDTG